MGKFAEILSKARDPKSESLNPVWSDHFPTLAEAFYPAPGKASGTYVTPKHSVTLFSDGLTLKAVVGARDAKRKFWLTLDGPEAVLEQIELALISGHGEWRDVTE
jgi:hypothetical protein